MATLIGIVSKVIGQVFAVASDGTRRTLVEGDRLFAGDQLSTGAEGAVAVHLQNGQELTLGRGSSMQMTPQLLANQIPHVDSHEAATPSEAQLTDVEQLQKAIAAGDDPTQSAEATAAGPATTTGVPGGIQGSGHSFVMLEEVGGRVDPIIGFPTAGFNGIPELPEERLNANPDNNVVEAAAPVVPPVTPEVPNNPVSLDGLSAQNGELTVNEANLADGSASNPGALTQSGAFTVNAPDGLASLSIGGINVISGGVPAGIPQSITTPLGSTLTITGYNPATGVVSYSYTLNGAETHASGEGANSLGEHITVVANDSNGDTTTGSLDINITDDVPKAVDDSNGTASETLLTLNGNVLSNDVQGADRVTLGENSGPITPGTFTGTYGTLVLNANGTYTYTLNISDADFKALHGGGSATETFTYTLTDADGDSSTANLVLQIHNNDDSVTVGGLNVEGGELTVFEKNLSDGSSPDTPALTQSGTFTVTALDGVTTLSVGGIAVVTGGVAAGFPQSITTPLGSTLTITGFNAATGVVSYSYTLNDNEAHPTANGANSLPEQFAVTVVDDNGTTATGSLDVSIVDDLPKGVDDSNASTASESLLTLNGNVLSNDVQGADRVTVGENTGPITPGTFTGTYGTLVLNANGTYTYTLNTSDADFKALHGGGSATETFTYTLTDADGDSSTANLVLQIHNNDDSVTVGGLNVEGGELTVFEKNLSDGSSPDAPALTQSGTFTVTALDGVTTLSVGGIAVVTGGVAAGFPQSITTPLGSTLTITGFNAATGVVSYSYTLNDNEAHPTANGANSLPEQFAVTVVDDNGTTTTGSLDVNIVDDLPKGVDDSNASTASETLLTLNGNVLSNDVQGADRVTLGENAGPITPGTFTGTYGTLVLNANGTYTYTLTTSDADFKALHGGGSATETFTYTLTDADGDSSTANLVLQIHNNDDPVTIGGLNVEGGELTVFEKNLSDGSAPDAAALIQNGTFTVTALDGVTTLSVGGIAVVSGGVAAGFPQSITTPLGSTLTITGFNAATGVVSYSYTLNDNEAHPTANGANTLPEQFAVTVVDDNGTTTTGSLDVNIVDDLPKGMDDSNASTASETLLTLNGNVLSNDVQGADRVTLGENAGPITPGTFTGTYGTLVLNANGTYTYTLNPNDADFKALHGGGDGTETFTYTLTDSDGDTSTANLVLNIYNNDDPVLLNGLNVYGGELTVYEKNLSDGSSPDAPALTQSGTFTVTALDGLQTLTVGGIAVVSGGVAAGFPQSITTPLGSTLTVTGFNAATGVVSYSYTLNDNEAHPTANGANSLTENFNVVATDTDGDSSTGQINVNIIDDLPKGVYDSNASTASETLLTLNGNVLSNDVQGADRVTLGENSGPITPGTFTGTYGTLVLNANGTYIYTLNTSDADFKALHGGGDGSETFTYTLTDADGDSSTANLVLQIHNNDDSITIDGLNVEGGELTVFEKNLSDGSNPDAPALTRSGTFTVTALDGVTTLSVGGIAVVSGGVAAGFPQSVTTPLGSTLTITGFNAATGVVSYSYTLNDNEAHPTANGANSLPEQFAVTVVDNNGTTATGSLDVNIVDDLPKGVYDSNASTASETLLALSGNVLSNDVQGADRVTVGANSGPITPGTFTGIYGTLVLNANGTYIYTLNPNDTDFKALHGGGNGSETFTYTITDSDGDSSTANLVLNVYNNDDPVVLNGLDVYGGELTVYEKNLSDGSSPDAPALTQSGTFTVTALDGVTTLSVGGIAVVSGGVAAGFPQSVTTPLGSTLTITGFNAVTGVVSYSYTLNDNEAHPTANGANSLPEQFAVTVVDDNGTTATGSLDVNIVDDLPKGVYDSNGTASETLLTLSGNVLSNDVQGADRVTVGANSGPITPGTFTGTYGTLVLNANGTYTYTLNPSDADFKALHGGGNGSETFTYTITDADGDSSTANLVLNVYNNDDPVVLNGLDVYGGELTVYEKNLSDGSNPNTPALTQSGTFTVTALDGVTTLSVGGIAVVSGGVAAGFPQSITTPLGSTLTITGFNAVTGVVSYSYTLNDNEAHPTANGANTLPEQFAVTVVDDNGTTATGSLDVNIVDDLPKGVYDSNASTASETLLTLSGNVLSNDVQGADRVALGANAGPITPGTFTGTYGTLVLNANGTYTYTLNTSDADFKALHGGGNGSETFTYTLTDSDGDSSTANLVLNVYNNDDPVVLNGLDVYGGELTVYEKNLSDGSSPSVSALTQNGTFTVTALDGLQTLTVGGIAVVSGGVAAGFPQTAVTPLGSTLTITGFNAVTGVVSYSYTLNDNEAHPSANGANSLPESFNVVATDTDGDTMTGQINVNIIDDLPSAKPDSSSVVEGGTVNISVLGNDVSGADGPATVVGVRAGSNTSTSAIGGLGNQINGTYGYLTLDANGNAVYHSNQNSVGDAGATDTFTYTVRDSDGDESTTTITIDVANSAIKANPDSDVTVYEKALDLSKDGQDLAAGTVTGSDPGNTGETASGTLVGSVSGGSGTLTYTLVGSATGTYGQILLNPDGSYTYTLTSAPKTSPNANDGPNSLSESFTYKATDALGNSSTSTIVVNIVDDVPKAVATDRSVAAVEIDSNLLIVLDVSGSMADPSGVSGLSRLDLAKQAISALLDKYDDLGDVKVQLVTFSSSATDRTSVWVDVATAKTLLAGLTANGGTNYDAAVATMQTAFNTSGKLTGAQNVGYFFSDGKPTAGQEIGSADETALKAFLDANNIKNYAIGLGSGVTNANLNPLAYDGSSHTDTNAVVVTDLNQLNSVLSGTVIGAPVTGSLLGEGGSFGADGGFIKTITVDGTTYTYDPSGNSNQGSLNFSGGPNHGTFNTVDNTLSIATNNSGTLQINLDTGEYAYISQKTTSVLITENIGFTASDNDGDLASSTLTVKVIPNAPPVAADDNVITNVLSGTIVVPGELLLANDTDPNGDQLSATPTSFNTGWIARGADFTGTGAISFAGTNNNSANQNLSDVRNAFAANTAAMTAVLVVSGYLGAVSNSNANDEDLITVKLKQGETLNLDHNLASGHITMEYSLNGGAFVNIADGGTITASADGTYQIHMTNITDPGNGNTNAAENYQLTMTVNYAGAHDVTPDYHGTYTANDNHGGSDSANLTISYQDGHTLTGTSGDDILVAGTGNNIINAGDGNDVLTAGSGNNELHGGAGNDWLYSGPGNDILDGGTGIDTASFSHATAGVTVNLSLAGAQNTLGAGTDTLTGIENLVGSNFNDTLTGDNNNNVINGGLGNDILNGGGGDDLLIGDLGNNTLTGGAGADTFQWLKGNSGHDVITDFTPGTDKLDLSQLLQGENGTTASLDDYLHFTVTGSGPSTVTSIDVSAMAGAAPNQTIDLAGVNLASHYGVTPG
ncbi:retention module-containing protein, partial [Pseudomonas sp. Pseusp3]|uniref:retention module-containing protein n=1 Tax=Pseudomonas sp. Pseusp3 TaxID=3243029 RepID=UPI0039AFC759